MASPAIAASAGQAETVQAQRRRAQATTRTLLLAPAMLIIGIFGILPLFIILIYSFLTPGPFGGVVWEFSTDAYVQFLFERDIFDESVLIFTTSYLEIFARSIIQAAIATVICLLIGFPTAYFMATRPPSQRNFWLFLITVPFWTNLLIRTFAIMLIIRDEGLVNGFLMWLGVIERPIVILYTDVAIALGLLYSFLPFMVLPLYASLEKLDFRLVEAAFDLYATRGQVLRRIIIPLARPGIVAGCVLVFIPAIGAYITPLLLGGGKELMIGNLIALQFGGSRNWPFGSAAALILMTLVMTALLVYVRATTGRGQGRHG
jgi:spermidine/putrescine transport system permease protein